MDAWPGEAAVDVLVLRTPGAGSNYIESVISLLASEIVACTCAPVRVRTAVGTPTDRLPYGYDVLVHLDPLDDVLDVAVSFAATRGSYRFRTDCGSPHDVRAIAREIGANIDAHLRHRDQRSRTAGASR